MTTFAQGAVPCTAIADDAERLACYDKALRPAAPAPVATTPAATPQPAAPLTARPDERRQERRVRESAAPGPAAVPPAPTAPRAGAPADEAIVAVVVVGLRALPGRETTFTTEDGVTWVQTDSQRLIGLPDTPFPAEIRPGAMGSYFLVPAERGRAVRVRPAR